MDSRRSADDSGTTTFTRLRMAGHEGAAAVSSAAPARRPWNRVGHAGADNHGMAKLYLIDDHPVVLAGLRALLEAGGHEIVGEARDAPSGLSGVLQALPEIVLLDIHMGKPSGLDMLEELQRLGHPTSVIMLTASATTHDVSRALRAGARGYLVKNSVGDELLGCVAAVAAGQRYLGAGLADLAVRSLTEPQTGMEQLSVRERQIVGMVAHGATSAAIGEQLHLSPKTVDTYRSRAMAKLGVPDLAGLVRWAVREGLVDLDAELPGKYLP